MSVDFTVLFQPYVFQAQPTLKPIVHPITASTDENSGAENGYRTRDLNLGKVSLYH